MNAAYVDTSSLVAIAFGEAGATAVTERLESCDALYASNLVEAELRSTFAREGAPLDDALLSWVHWILPDRPLGREIGQVLSLGQVRGADAWHLACALYLAQTARELAFVTLDARQEESARRLGFLT